MTKINEIRDVPTATHKPLLILRFWRPDDEDVQRHYSGLMHLFDYKRMKDGTTESRFLWRAYHRTAVPRGAETELFPFIYTASAPERREVSFGWRLFDYQREGATRKLSLFFLPAIQWGK